MANENRFRKDVKSLALYSSLSKLGCLLFPWRQLNVINLLVYEPSVTKSPGMNRTLI